MKTFQIDIEAVAIALSSLAIIAEQVKDDFADLHSANETRKHEARQRTFSKWLKRLSDD